MEHNPYLHRPTYPHPPTQPASGKDLSPFEFEFPTAISDPGMNPALSNDILFCGKIIARQTDPNPPHAVPKNPFLLRSESFGRINSDRHNRSISYSQSSSAGENRRRRSSGSWKNYNGLFGALKYPLQMELSDIRMRQERRVSASLPRLPVDGDGATMTGGGRKSRWDLVRRLSLRRRGPPMSAFAKASFGCLPIPLA